MPKDNLDLENIAESVGEVKTAFEEFKRTHEEQIKEAAKGVVDPILEEKMSKINESIDSHQERLDQLWMAQKRRNIQLDGKDVSLEELDAKALHWANMCAKARGSRVGEFDHEALQAYGKAFTAMMRKGEKVLEGDEYKALSVGSDPDGGYVVSPDTSGRIVERIFESSPMRAFASTQVISTDALEGLHDVDEAGSGWVGETESRTETTTPQLDKWRIPVHELCAKPHATQKFLDDAEIDPEAWLAAKVGAKFARDENTAFVTGNGIGKPRGFTDYANWASAGVFEIGAIEQFATGSSGAFAADPNGPDVLYDTIYGLIAQYHANANWFMNRSTAGVVRKMQDSNGAYQWQPSVAAGQPATLAGYPVAIFADMPDIAASSLSIAFGDMAQAYQIVDRIGIRTLRDPYSSKPYVEFYTTKRVGGDVVNFEALKFIAFNA